MGDRFFSKLMSGTAPLLVWAGHFFFCYVFVAAACTTGTVEAANVRMILAGVSLAAIAATVAMLWRPVAQCMRDARADGLLGSVRLFSGVLALIAIVWTSLPLAMLPVC